MRTLDNNLYISEATLSPSVVKKFTGFLFLKVKTQFPKLKCNSLVKQLTLKKKKKKREFK